MTSSKFDHELLERCLAEQDGAWEDFADRFMNLVLRIVQHTAQIRNAVLADSDRDDLVAEVFMRIVDDDYSILRKFRGESSLATYLTVVSRRIVVRQLVKHQNYLRKNVALDQVEEPSNPVESQVNQDSFLKMLKTLEPVEQQVVGMFHLEGKSYEEIHQRLDIAVNSIGPMLSRARAKMKKPAKEVSQ